MEENKDMNYYIQNGLVYVDGAFVEMALHIVDGKIEFAGAVPAGAEVIDAGGYQIVPGFIDTHMHGAVGHDVNGSTAEDLETIGAFLAQHGTTAFQCSVLTDTQSQTEWCIGQFNRYREVPRQGAELVGIHLEGPFLATAYKGAMPEHLLQNSNIDLVRHYQALAHGGIRYITISPELPGVLSMIPELRGLGITVGIGHSGATYDQAMEAITLGASVGTHVGNAMRLFHQHEPAIFGAVMESDVYCETICDGRHLVPGTVRMYFKCKGPQRIVAITDSIMAAGLPDGNYHLGVNDVVVKDGDAKLASDGTRAGSTLTQDTALKNMLAWLPLSLEEILPTLTENPAREMSLWDTKGSIAPGKDADLVFLDANADIAQVYTRGVRCK
ncbi:MAG: N-acetylglucosamine-6-phosphate deacetylase [Candidatus Faecousia sp.]|nr:N-acetylglucosamine-6-phosphate deacetylase [Candidatus Faecousia sp.]